jgi:hypothetical protein
MASVEQQVCRVSLTFTPPEDETEFTPSPMVLPLVLWVLFWLLDNLTPVPREEAAFRPKDGREKDDSDANRE